MTTRPAGKTRYEQGQVVRVSAIVRNRHVGQFGTIVQVKPDRAGAHILDKYVLRFADNDQEEFWDMQLETESSAQQG